MSNMNLVCGLDSRIFWWKFKLIENKRCLSQRLKSSFLFVNEPFAIKCCATTQTKALLYIYWPLMINMLFVEQISFQINFSAGNILCGGDLSITCRATKRSSFIDMRYGTNLADFRHHRMMILKVMSTDVKTGENCGKELENVWWIFHQLAAKNLNVNTVERSVASVIRYCKGQKNI